MVATTLVASKNEDYLNSGQKWLKNNRFALR